MKEENQAIIKTLNMYGRVPEQWELLTEIERLNNIIKEVREILNSKRNILTTQLLNEEYCDYEELLYQIDEEIRKILDKVEENK